MGDAFELTRGERAAIVRARRRAERMNDLDGFLDRVHDASRKNWIAGAIGKPGALHKALGVPKGKKIPAAKLNAAAKKGGKLGKQANLAKTLKAMHK